MSLAVLAFWLALLVPGYAIARRVDPEGVASGFPSAIALSFVAAFVALAAVIIPAHVIGVPIVVLTVAVVGFVVWGASDLFRSDGLNSLGRIFVAAIGLEVIVVLVDLILGGRIGTILGADAIVHVARVRFLLEQGLGNGDPFIGGYFYPIYHTNPLHALLACASHITREDPLTVWFSSLPFAKLLVVSGAWYAGWAIFRSSAAGWVTALFVIGSRGPVTFMLYPNQLAPWFLLPVLIGFVIRAVADGAERRHVIGIGTTSLAIAGTHGMYAGFAVMAIGPALAGFAVLQWRRRADDRHVFTACVLALCVGLPYPVVTFVTQRAASTSARATDDRALRTEATADHPQLPTISNLFRRLDGGLVMHEIGRGFTGNRGLRVYVFAMGAALAIIVGRRRETVLLCGVLLTVAAWLHVPPLCTLLLRVGGAEWIVLRFGSILDVLLALSVPGSLIAVADLAARHPTTTNRTAFLVFRWTLGASCIFAGAFFAAQRQPYDWRSYLDRGRLPASALRGSQLNPLLRFAGDLKASVPSDVVVLADPSIGMRVVMAHDCRVVASTSSSVGVRGLGMRTRDVHRMLRQATSEEDRDALVVRYGVTHVVASRPAPAWTMDRMRSFHVTEFGWCIMALRDHQDSLKPVEGDYHLALLDAGRVDEAIELLQEMIRSEPGRFEYWFLLGRTLYGIGSVLDAVGAFEQALVLRPDDPRPAIMIGNAYADLEWTVEAIAAYRDTAAIAERVNDRSAAASAEFNIGNMYYRLGRWDEAIEAYRAALRVDSGHDGAAKWLAEAQSAARRGAASPSDPDPEPEQ